jgi:hypothetical protein
MEGIVSTVTGVATIPAILAIFGGFTKGGLSADESLPFATLSALTALGTRQKCRLDLHDGILL